jgi:hydroxylysine kinase
VRRIIRTPAADMLGALQQRPEFAAAEISDILKLEFDLAGTLTPLYGERDQNFRLAHPGHADYVVKIADATDGLDQIEFQNDALLAVAESAPELCVPRLVRSVSGAPTYVLQRASHDYAVRVLTYVNGQPQSGYSGSPRVRQNVGVFCARLACALAVVSPPAKRKRLIWDLQNAGETLALSKYLTDLRQRALVEHVHGTFLSQTQSALTSLPKQAIHNDLNKNNVLVATGTDQIAGVIDFGDAVYAPAIVDLAVAMAHQCRDETDSVAAACDVLKGYHAVKPLTEQEVNLLWDLICTRISIGVAIRAWRTATVPEICSYDPKKYERLWISLEALLRSGAEAITDVFCAAIGSAFRKTAKTDKGRKL